MTNPSGARSVLLVEPHADTREMYAAYFRQAGLVPVGVDNAVDAFAQAPGVDVVVTGIVLRGKEDGVELVQRLRHHRNTDQTPIIVLTACAWQAERERAQRAGCDVFLPKPCAPQDLLREVQRVLAQSAVLRERARSARADAAEEHHRADRILKKSADLAAKRGTSVARRCPRCGSLAAVDLPHTSQASSDVDHFRCDSCGNVWFEPKASP
jgi:DNA-binding response OmpR family regulator